MMQYRPIYRILLILENPEVSSRIVDRFRERGDDVLIASDAAHGMELCATHRPDLVLLDWQQPEKDSAICKQIIRHNPSTNAVLCVNEKMSVKEISQGFDAGACDYIRYTLPFEELIERVDVRLQHSCSEKILTFSHITINQTRHKVYSHEKEVTLSKKEYSLLEYLVLRKNQVCTREDIVAHIWEVQYACDTGFMDVIMSSLRKKVLHKSSSANIRTIRGVGFIAEE
ncbi:MAG: response regulator transcription factor [Bacteroidaceae bacterium]|nr:response regulator transcription factor [Bacteroidaceae bacterium]